jgi:hypothetical protein
MATINITPASTVSNDWTISGGSGTVHQNLADSSDSSYIYTADQNDVAIVILSNSLDYHSPATIDSIRFYIRGVYTNTRSGNTDIQVILTDASATTYYAETITLNFTAGYSPEDHYGTARTTSDGSSAWTASNIDGLRLNINTSPEDPSGSTRAQVAKAYVEVTYTEAVAADNSIFFGTNF